jgi:hypothetical protein
MVSQYIHKYKYLFYEVTQGDLCSLLVGCSGWLGVLLLVLVHVDPQPVANSFDGIIIRD